MASIFVPSQMRSPLVQLAAQSDDAVSELCNMLESNPDVLITRQAALEQASKLTKLDDAFPVVEAVINLLYYKASTGKSTSDLVKEITARLTTGDKSESKLSSTAIPNFQKQLGRILELSGLTLKAKALSLAADCQRLFSDAKILSDIRPVFGDDVSVAPKGVVVLHTLKVGFAEDGEEREFFVTLDSQDLRELQTCVARALSKDVSLSQLVNQSNLQKFETSK